MRLLDRLSATDGQWDWNIVVRPTLGNLPELYKLADARVEFKRFRNDTSIPGN